MTLYRYNAPPRLNDKSSTKSFRKRLSKIELEIISCDRGFCQCKGSDGNYYDWIPLDQLQEIPSTGEVAA